MDVSTLPVVAVAEFFKRHVPGLTLSQRRNLNCYGHLYLSRYPERLYGILHDKMKEADQDAFNAQFVAHLTKFRDPHFSEILEGTLIDILMGTSSDQRVKKKVDQEKLAKKLFGDLYFNNNMPNPLSIMKLIVNLKNRKESFLYDPELDVQHKFDYDIIMGDLKTILDKDFPVWKETNAEGCILAYTPNKPRMFPGEDGQTIFNTWKEATWHTEWTPDPQAVCPPEIDEYFTHFLQDEDSRRFCKAWLRDAAFDRAEPILVLCANPGTGKNIFIEHIATALVGEHNYRSASRGFNRSQFHNNVSNCRLFFLDEMSLSADLREALKSYHNGKAAIERKGKDVGDPEKLFASFAIANNHKHMVRLEYTDRKFYVPLVTQTPLLDSMGQDKIDHLTQVLLKDKDYVRQFASYLFHNFKAQEAAKFPKNELFKKLCINSYKPMFRRFIQACRLRKEFVSTEFNRGSRVVIDPVELNDCIDTHEVEFKERLATLQVEMNGRWTATSLVYDGQASTNSLDSKSSNGHLNGNGTSTRTDVLEEDDQLAL